MQPDATTPRTREEIAPEPLNDGTATVDSVARHNLAFSVAATSGFTGVGNRQELTAWAVGSFSAAFLLREFAKADPEAADAAARMLVGLNDDPRGAHELAWQWLVEYGIDPDEVVAAAQFELAERAEARKAATR